MLRKVPGDPVLSKAFTVCSFRGILQPGAERLFPILKSLQVYTALFMNHFLMQFSLWYSHLPETAVDKLSFLVGFSRASAKLIPQLFLQGFYTSWLSYTCYCINFYLPCALWTPPPESESNSSWGHDWRGEYFWEEMADLSCPATTMDFLPDQVCVWCCTQ